jgi:hypothetical protein
MALAFLGPAATQEKENPRQTQHPGDFRSGATGAPGLLFFNVGIASGQFIIVTMEKNAHVGPW